MINTIRQVPSKVLNRRSTNTLEAEREQFDKVQCTSISKAISSSEAPVKEKHARRIILGTHHEKGAFTFWSYAIGLPLPSSSIISWKFCHVVHKILRDGHPNVLQDCMRHQSNIREMGSLWGHLHDKYGQLVAIYSSLLINKMNFHAKRTQFPGNLEMQDEELEKAAGTDINYVFQLTVDLFDYLSCELKLAETVFRQLNTSIAVSQTSSGQCRLSPMIQVIQDCSHLYHYIVKLLFKLHACLPVETLQGHRERFHDQFHSLKNFFNRARDMLYFKRLIQIPKLPDSPPNFLRASALAEHVKPVVVMSDDVPDDEEPEALIEVTSAPQTQQQNVVDMFDQAFGPPSNGFDDRDVQIDNLKREVEMLRAELERIKSEAQRYITQLKSQINSLEAELEEQRTQKQKALVENEQLRMELESLRRQRAEGESQLGQVLEAEKRAQATEQRYNKLKDKHNDLVSSHAELLRKSADTSKMLSATQQSQEEVARTKQQLAFEVEQVKQASEMKIEEQNVQLERLRRELEASRAELSHIQSTLQSSEQSGQKLSSMLGGLQEEEGVLRKKLAQQEAELCSLKSEVQQSQSSLQQEKERSSRELGELQGRLREKSSQEDLLQQKLLDEQFRLLQGTVAEAENIIQDAVARLDDPLHVRCTSSPDYLICRAEATLGSIDSVQRGHAEYLKNMGDAGSLVRPLTQFAHLTADTVVNGSATAHLAPTDHADKLTDSCRDCGNVSLQFLKDLKSKQSLARASPAAIKLIIEKILQLGKDLRPKSMDFNQEELGDMVDKEMAATSAAIEEAVRRIEEMMNQARKDSSGVKLEVNERILNSCTNLMKAIHLLVTASTELQREIVDSGRGAATQKEFYAKNSRWTEGLISASKAVGWGATQMVESADKVVLHTGKYEELIVCSHEIAASTAQLVAASKVKADLHSKKLTKLQQASRHVNDMAANVVASTKSGQEQIEDKDTMDFSGMSLIKLRKEEMESQVKVLELETQLQGERMRLGDLRKKHYELAGGCDFSPEEAVLIKEAPASLMANKPSILKKPPLAQKPTMPPKNNSQLNISDGLYKAHFRH
ncbi:huntingtin-interacting protein 1-related protein-like [Huso huso]|uniref:Huntingtin-interacting protein 1-related protein-like n=1 Tax=Huso huso TaxID=61971 RepID=A0ABR0ZFJ8_HUSHU